MEEEEERRWEERGAWKMGEAGLVFLWLLRKHSPVPANEGSPTVWPGSFRAGALVPSYAPTLRGQSTKDKILPWEVTQALCLNIVPEGVKNPQGHQSC